MAQIDFLLPQSKRIWQHLETAATRSHHDAGRAFEDFLGMTLCVLSGGQMEEQYLKIVERYREGQPGRRAIDAFPDAAAALIIAMAETRKDILGDIFQGAISRGHNGQYFTPDPVCEAMAHIAINQDASTVIDPCCGSGRFLLAAADVNPRAELYGQDIDLRCVRMTAINLALRNLYGWVIHGDSLANERRLVYRTGFSGHGLIAEVPPEQCPEPVQRTIEAVREAGTQLMLF